MGQRQENAPAPAPTITAQAVEGQAQPQGSPRWQLRGRRGGGDNGAGFESFYEDEHDGDGDAGQRRPRQHRPRSWRDAVRWAWLSSIRLPHPEPMPPALSVGRQQPLQPPTPPSPAAGAPPEAGNATEQHNDGLLLRLSSVPYPPEKRKAEKSAVSLAQGVDQDDGLELPDKEGRQVLWQTCDKNGSGQLSLTGATRLGLLMDPSYSTVHAYVHA